MKLSVILPCFNGAATIAVQLEALTKQQWSDSWEVIVSNNGSTDESMTIVERYRDRLPQLQIVDAYTPPGPRLGVPHSYNTGIKAATGDAFVFCESDDEVALGWLAAMGAALLKHELVVGRLDYEKLNEPWRLDGYEGSQVTGLCEIDYPPYLAYASACNFGMRRSVYETIGELCTAFPCSHDTEYCWRAQRAGIQLHFVPNAVIHYRLRHDLKSIYRQARGWGKDFTLVRKYYRCPLGKLDPVRMVIRLAMMLPEGAWLFLQMQRQAPHSRSLFTQWFWYFCFCLGMFQGLIQNLPASLREVSTSSQPTPLSVSSF